MFDDLYLAAQDTAVQTARKSWEKLIAALDQCAADYTQLHNAYEAAEKAVGTARVAYAWMGNANLQTAAIGKQVHVHYDMQAFRLDLLVPARDYLRTLVDAGEAMSEAEIKTAATTLAGHFDQQSWRNGPPACGRCAEFKKLDPRVKIVLK